MATDVTWRTEPGFGIRYTSGLTIYDEALVGGRLLGRYWAADGFVEVEETAADMASRAGAPTHAFTLELDGQALHFGWGFLGVRELEPERPGTRHVVVELEHALRPARVRVHTVLDGGPVLVRWLEVANAGQRPAALAAVAPWGGVLMRVRSVEYRPGMPGQPGRRFSLGRFLDPEWGGEGDFGWEALPVGTRRIEARRGRSGRPAPFFVVRNDATGELAVGHVGWSGNWAVELLYEEDVRGREAWVAWRAGPAGPGPLRVVAPGETVATPAIHLGYLFGDLDEAVQAMHEHVRAGVFLPQPEGRADRVVYNHWGYVRHELTEAALRHEIDVAREVGAELFVVDAGWFGGAGSNWATTVGDWRPGDRLPDGLEPVFAYARERGLLYGLWMDAERIGPESQTARDHPDWLMRRDGAPVGTALDLANPEAAAWLEGEIDRLVDTYDLDLFRLDYNVDVWEGGYRERDGYYENALWRHYEALYGIFDRLHRRRPRLLLENCSSGGGRTDLGLLRRFHYTWITDWQLAPRNIKIFNGMTLALPPEACDRNAGVGQDSHWRGDLDTQMRSCMLGHFTLTGIYPPGGRANPDHLDRVRHHVQVYKEQIRPWLRSCRLYHHTPVLEGSEPEGWCALELVSRDRRRAACALFRLAGAAEPEYRLRPRGLDPGLTYRVTSDNTAMGFERDGLALRDQGIGIRLDRPLASELLLIEVV